MPRSQSNREAIGARLRFEVLTRCNFACYYCGTPASMGVKVLHIDHVVPVALGGTNDPWNLVAACWDCNAGKTNSVPSEALIRAVKRDESLHQMSGGREVIMCKFCCIPVDVSDDEDLADHCALCDMVMFYGYDAGAGNAREWLAP